MAEFTSSSAGSLQIFRFDKLDSTNLQARRLLQAECIKGQALITAREQTAGRGTHGRSWSSPRDSGIYMSVVQTELGEITAGLDALTVASGVACVELLRGKMKLHVQIEAINNIVVGGLKLGGILTEAFIERRNLDALITGVGINIARANRQLPEGAVQPVSLEELLPPAEFKKLQTDSLEAELAGRIISWNTLALEGDTQPIKGAWQRCCVRGARFPS